MADRSTGGRSGRVDTSAEFAEQQRRLLTPESFDILQRAWHRARWAVVVPTVLAWLWLPIVAFAARYSIQVREVDPQRAHQIGAANTGWYWANIAAQFAVSLALLAAGVLTFLWLYGWFERHRAAVGRAPGYIMFGLFLAFLLGPIGVLVLAYYLRSALKSSGGVPTALFTGWAVTFFGAMLAQTAVRNTLQYVGTPGVEQPAQGGDVANQIANLHAAPWAILVYAVLLTIAVPLWWRLMSLLQGRLDALGPRPR